jgi:hypothetical protein
MGMLSEHELLGETYWAGGRSAAWVIGTPGTSVYKVEIIAGIMGSLVVHGDFDFARFAHFGDREDAWSRLLWMAYCTDVGYYVAQKASIGLRRQATEEYDASVAEHDLKYWIREAETDGAAERANVLREALDEYADDEQELRRFLSENARTNDLWECRIGTVLRWDVIVSHVALNKCASLLWEKYGAEGPKECRAT